MASSSLRLGSSLLLLLFALLPQHALAQDDEPRLRWSDDWERVHPVSYVASPLLFGGSLLLDALYEPDSESRVRGPLLFDALVRESLASPRDEGRELAASVSDAMLAALIVWPLVDSVGVAGLGDWNSDVFLQLSMIAVESIAADYVLSTVIKLLVHRERPHGDRCSREDRETDPGRCGTHGRNRSFYSGHASSAFNGAGLVCISHAYLPLYGSVAADAFACGAALLSASIVSVLRVVADRHHSTDVLFGAAMGLLTGMLLPYLLHFNLDTRSEPPDGRTDMLRTVRFPVMGATF